MNAKTDNLPHDFAAADEKDAHAGSRLALGAINFYRRFISPYKGFKCANGAMGHQTCSTRGLELFRELPLREAFARQRDYMKQCGDMAAIFNIAVRNEPQEAAHQISSVFGKTAEEAAELVGIAIAYQGEAAEKRRNRRANETRDCAFDAAAISCLPHPFRIDSCDIVGTCDGPGGCDGPGPC